MYSDRKKFQSILIHSGLQKISGIIVDKTVAKEKKVKGKNQETGNKEHIVKQALNDMRLVLFN